MRTTAQLGLLGLFALALIAGSRPAAAQLYRVEELTIAGIHSGLEQGRFN